MIIEIFGYGTTWLEVEERRLFFYTDFPIFMK